MPRSSNNTANIITTTRNSAGQYGVAQAPFGINTVRSSCAARGSSTGNTQLNDGNMIDCGYVPPPPPPPPGEQTLKAPQLQMKPPQTLQMPKIIQPGAQAELKLPQLQMKPPQTLQMPKIIGGARQPTQLPNLQMKPPQSLQMPKITQG